MPSLQHLVVFIPGIGGSVLRPVGKHDGGWELSRGGLAGAVVRPSRLDISRNLVPVDLVSTCRVIPPFFKIQGYEDRVHQFMTRFTNPVIQTWQPGVPIGTRTDVLLFPYDFRRSIADAAELLESAVGAWLQDVPADRRARRVIVLAHSMGGLVARYWLGPLGGYRWCEALITLGTPFRGAPKALDWLVNGVGLGPVRHHEATEVLRGWPSLYELLPQYDAVWDHASGKPFELVTIPKTMAGLESYAPRFAAGAAAAQAVHEQIAAAWQRIEPQHLPQVIPVIGRGHATPNTAILRAGELRVTKDDPPWRGNAGWRGDGTVPMLSAIPHELGADAHKPLWRVVADRHGPIGCNPEPLNLLELYSGQPVPSRGGELPDRPWIALDLEEVVAAGSPWRLDAWIEPAEFRAGSMQVLINPLYGGPQHRDRCAQDGRGWTVVVPPLPPGLYQVSVEASDVDRVGLLRATDVIAVIDAATMQEDET